MKQVEQFLTKIGPWCFPLGAGVTTKLAADKLLGKRITWSGAILSSFIGIFIGYACGTAWESWIGPKYHLHVAGAAAMFGKDFVLWVFGNWDFIMRGIFGKLIKKEPPADDSDKAV